MRDKRKYSAAERNKIISEFAEVRQSWKGDLVQGVVLDRETGSVGLSLPVSIPVGSTTVFYDEYKNDQDVNDYYRQWFMVDRPHLYTFLVQTFGFDSRKVNVRGVGERYEKTAIHTQFEPDSFRLNELLVKFGTADYLWHDLSADKRYVLALIGHLEDCFIHPRSLFQRVGYRGTLFDQLE